MKHYSMWIEKRRKYDFDLAAHLFFSEAGMTNVYIAKIEFYFLGCAHKHTFNRQ